MGVEHRVWIRVVYGSDKPAGWMNPWVGSGGRGPKGPGGRDKPGGLDLKVGWTRGSDGPGGRGLNGPGGRIDPGSDGPGVRWTQEFGSRGRKDP